MPALAKTTVMYRPEERAGALTGVTQSAEDGAEAGYKSLKSLSLSTGQIAGVALGIVVAFGLTILALWYLCIRQTRKRRLRRDAGRNLGNEERAMRTREAGRGTVIATPCTRGPQAGITAHGVAKLGRGSQGTAPGGYGDYSQVRDFSGAGGTDGRRGVRGEYDEPGDVMGFLNDTTRVGDGPAVPLVAAAGATSGGAQRKPPRFSAEDCSPHHGWI